MAKETEWLQNASWLMRSLASRWLHCATRLSRTKAWLSEQTESRSVALVIAPWQEEAVSCAGCAQSGVQ